jgi:excisionase family DNA binding protein
MATNEKLALSVPEVAKLLGMSSSKVHETVKAKEIPSISFGKRIVIPNSSTLKPFPGLVFTKESFHRVW